MNVFRHHSAQATINRLPNRPLEASYSGLMTGDAFVALAPRVLEASNEAQFGVVLRMDAALIVAPLALPAGYSPSTSVAAVICLPCQYDQLVEYTTRLASRGVMRAVFLPSQLAHAFRWAAAHSAARLL